MVVVVVSGCGSGGQLVMSRGVGCGRVVESHSYIPNQPSQHLQKKKKRFITKKNIDLKPFFFPIFLVSYISNWLI